MGRTTFSGVGRAAGAGVDSTYAAGGEGLRSWLVERQVESGFVQFTEFEKSQVLDGAMQPLRAASQAARHKNLRELCDDTMH